MALNFLFFSRELGIECVGVSGYSKGIGYKARRSLAEKRSDHEWNAVFVGGQWWLLDACWGAGTVDMKSKTFVKRSGSSECQLYMSYSTPMTNHKWFLQTPLFVYILQHVSVGFLGE